MGKNKLAKFEELNHLERVFQPAFDDIFDQDFKLKGTWASAVFQNDHPLILELGCGKGEYTTGLGRLFPEKNFIGVDIKGARLWRGAKTAREEQIQNVAFIRTRIEFIRSFFERQEVSEIWLTFPDPQDKKRRNKKRLSGARFLNSYRNFLIDQGIIHLKTDSTRLYDYTRNLAEYNHFPIEVQTSNLYQDLHYDPILSIQTFYEKQFLSQGIPIKYLRFRLPEDQEIIELPDEMLD